MKFREIIFNKLILKDNFKYNPEDKYFTKKTLKFSKSKNPNVLDVDCGNGHYSFQSNTPLACCGDGKLSG